MNWFPVGYDEENDETDEDVSAEKNLYTIAMKVFVNSYRS
jgi:hypothetical protein